MFSVESLSRQLIDDFSPLLPRDHPVALVDYPESANCGDHAIWLGEKKLLSTLGVRLTYECSAQKYDPARMAEALGGGTILMHGGGNFGDRYRLYHEFRLKVTKDFPNNPIIIFPQQVTFLTNAYLRRTVSLFSEHPNVTMFARGVVAQHLMERYFGEHMKIVLGTDMAFMLGPQTRPADPIYDVVWIGRTDQESAGWNPASVIPGLAERPIERLSVPTGEDKVAFVLDSKRKGSTVMAADWYALLYASTDEQKIAEAFSYDARSEMFFHRANLLMSLGRLVITDRLHGHILCLLMGIPHILLNNDSGKNWNFYDCWTRDSGLCQLARNPAEAWAFAQAALTVLKDMDATQRLNWDWNDAARLVPAQSSVIRWA